MSCRAYSLQHNYLFWDLVAKYAYTKVSSGSPAVEGASYVSESECQEYAQSLGGGFSGTNSWSGYPNGCVLAAGLNAFLFNTNTNSLSCGNIDSGGIQRICIQKDTSQVTMLCHLGNTLQ